MVEALGIIIDRHPKGRPVKGNQTMIVLDIKDINCEFVSLTGFITLCKMLYRREVKKK